MTKATVNAYASAGCVLLAFDWEQGIHHKDFLGFAIQRNPGYTKKGDPQFLFNKLDFVPIAKDAKPKGSDVAPIQKFNWWDGGINLKDRGKTFQYTVTPVLGTGPNDLQLQAASAGTVSVTVPNPMENGIATYFNRAVVSAQSFLALKNDLRVRMEWLANGLQQAIPEVLASSEAFDCAIYHLSDGLWVLPAFEKFTGRGSIIYFSKGDDDKSQSAIDLLNEKTHNISTHNRDAISHLMHDKFIVSHRGGKDVAVLMGSTNFTPEAQTIQANLLHIIQSPQLAKLYQKRATLLTANKKTKDTAVGAAWTSVTDIPGSDIRVYFLPEPGSDRQFLDTVTNAVKGAKSSVLFCMFTATDTQLMNAIFAQADSNDHLVYGLLNSIDDPEKPTKSGKKRNLPEIAVTIFHRSKEKPDTLPYSAFGKNAPRGFLPELRTIDCRKYDVSASPADKTKRSPPPIHVHHKFIVIDGETANPTIYTGSPNFSKSSENSNDENVLEIKNNQHVARAYVAEFMRLYNHYRARAIWNRTHEQSHKVNDDGDALILKKTRDEWVGDAYREGTKRYMARTRGL